jgi:hypothetical protein
VDNSRILVISDMHMPHAHVDVLAFLTALKAVYKPTRVICLGDEVDKHAMSFHDHDPDGYSAGHELDAAIYRLRPIYALFPRVDLLTSNHGSLAYRKALHHGIPKKYMRPYREVLGAPEGWVWHRHLIVRSGKTDVFFCHGLSSDVMKVVHRVGMSAVQGHFHTKFEITYTSGFVGEDRYGATAGCLVDDAAYALAYNKMHLDRPILGCMTITKGSPQLWKMHLDAEKRWTRSFI